MNHIELFAGCGGLCLGLSKAGFELELANELSPMASETFAYNLLGENLSDAPEKSTHTLWLSSQFPRSEMAKRLREDPRFYPDNQNSDLTDCPEALEGSLVVGNIRALIAWLEKHPELINHLRAKNVDIVSGGPPCQSFSLAGLREKNNDKNSLPWDFARFVDLVRPKSVLLENVTGILRPFTEDGKKYHAWFEVAKAFAMIGYVPLALHINAKYAGVAQNRPRFILFCLREDIFKQVEKELNCSEQFIFSSSKIFYQKVQSDLPTVVSDLDVHDLNKEETSLFDLFQDSFLSPLCARPSGFVSVIEAIGDLSESDRRKKSAYVRRINTLFTEHLKNPSKELTGNRLIGITPRVQRRYRIYQVLVQLSKEAQKAVTQVLSGKSEKISTEIWHEVRSHEFLQEDGSLARFLKQGDFEHFLLAHQTKKQTQRALIGTEPAPAALSIPDDACHYSDIRTLTTREMARIQSFPDGFVFRSKATTGGLNRRFEVPIYTQIGNAVPVLLGYALGLAAKNLLNRVAS